MNADETAEQMKKKWTVKANEFIDIKTAKTGLQSIGAYMVENIGFMLTHLGLVGMAQSTLAK